MDIWASPSGDFAWYSCNTRHSNAMGLLYQDQCGVWFVFFEPTKNGGSHAALMSFVRVHEGFEVRKSQKSPVTPIHEHQWLCENMWTPRHQGLDPSVTTEMLGTRPGDSAPELGQVTWSTKFNRSSDLAAMVQHPCSLIPYSQVVFSMWYLNVGIHTGFLMNSVSLRGVRRLLVPLFSWCKYTILTQGLFGKRFLVQWNEMVHA